MTDSRPFSDLLRAWALEEDDPDLESDAVQVVQHLANLLLHEYEPTNMDSFENRIERWLNNVSDERDKKVLLSTISHLFFAGTREFTSLYRTAFAEICRWITEDEGLDISDPEYQKALELAVGETWICPITDSLRINSFLKTNSVPGHDQRPHWRALAEFSDPERIMIYADANEIKRIVLLEDFVGSGSQISGTIEFAATTFPDMPFLVCPLIACPAGAQALMDSCEVHKNLSFVSPLKLPQEHFLRHTPFSGEPATYAKARELMIRYGSKVSPSGKDLFGFCDTGAMVVLYSNCPDNTVSLIWNESEEWAPLFPRIWRPE
jgi:hypothetical protein